MTLLALSAWLALRSRARGILAGVMLGAATLVAVWLVRLPVVLGAHWWRRRYGISRSDYGTILVDPRLEPLRDRALVAEIEALAKAQGVGEVEIEVRDASRQTRAINAELYGVGPTKRIVFWDTALDGRLSRREIRSLAAHEFGHVEANHIWKSIAWLVLFAVPGAFVVARVTRRR